MLWNSSTSYYLFLIINQNLRLQIRKRDTSDDHAVTLPRKSELCDTAESSFVATRSNSSGTLTQGEHSFSSSLSDEHSLLEEQRPSFPAEKIPVCPSTARTSSFYFKASHRQISSKFSPVKQKDHDLKECHRDANHLLNSDHHASGNVDDAYPSWPEVIVKDIVQDVKVPKVFESAVFVSKFSIDPVESDSCENELHDSHNQHLAEKESECQTRKTISCHNNGILTHQVQY